MQLDEQRLRFRDAMASLSAAVNVVTTAGEAGRCGITATAVCSVTDTPPSVMVCINANSAMNPVTVIDRKPSTGIDCSTSSAGIMIFSAVR